MSATKTKSKIDGQTMTAIYYARDKIPINTVDFGASGYLDYPVARHNEDKQTRYIKIQKVVENWNDYMTASALSRYIVCGKIENVNTSFN